MAAQPANTDIQVFRRLRSYRQANRHESVAALTKRLRPLIMSIPADENLVEVKSRDTTVADFSPYMGQASFSSTRGFPVVIGLKDQVSFANAQANIPGVDFGFQIGEDKFLQPTPSALGGDMHQDARELVADVLV